MDTENLLKLLNAHEVRYVIIGASAFPVHGFVRATLDVDLFIEPTEENAFRTLQALSEFGYNVSELDINDILSNKVLLRQYIVETDIHPFVTGVKFQEIWEKKVESRYGSTPVFYAGLDSLITMKQAANRPKDQEDLKYLLKLKKGQR
ncbi:nucleotidyltransferase [bacterium]|nr:nucleotidyltransferase [bacterium]